MTGERSEAGTAEVLEIIEHSTLVAMDFYEVSARRHDAPREEVEDGQLTIQVQQRATDTNFGVRLTASVISLQGEATASVAGEYELLHGIAPSRRALQLFADEVSVMTVFPYVREAIATITAKVFGEPVHLPLIQRGEVVVNKDEV